MISKEEEGDYIDLHAVENNPRWVVKEEKDSKLHDSRYFQEELNRNRFNLDLARKYFGDMMPKTMMVVGEADPKKNKRNTPQKLYFVQERMIGKSLYRLSAEEIVKYIPEIDEYLARVVIMYTSTLAENKKEHEKGIGITVDYHLKNPFIGKIYGNENEEKDRLWLVDLFPMVDFIPPKDFIRFIKENPAAVLRTKGIDLEEGQFPKFYRALQDLENNTALLNNSKSGLK